jgi:hypothetical protein
MYTLIISRHRSLTGWNCWHFNWERLKGSALDCGTSVGICNSDRWANFISQLKFSWLDNLYVILSFHVFVLFLLKDSLTISFFTSYYKPTLFFFGFHFFIFCLVSSDYHPETGSKLRLEWQFLNVNWSTNSNYWFCLNFRIFVKSIHVYMIYLESITFTISSNLLLL